MNKKAYSTIELSARRNAQMGINMSEAYVECLVKAKKAMWMTAVKVLLILITVYFGLLVFMGNWYALVIAAPALIGSYMVHLYREIEYEYLYIDREIGIDRILAQSKRKKIETISVNQIEILAPEGSYHLDEYKNRDLKVKNYSAEAETEEQRRYVMICEGNRKLFLSLTPRFVKAIKSVAPRKVFME